MKFTTNLLIVACGLGSLSVAGCKSMSSSAPEATTMPAPSPGSTTMSAAPAMPQPVTIAPPAKDMTHVLEKDEPYFTSEPGPSATPAGTLKAGSKVLVIIPGAPYSQVMTDTGVSAYTVTDGLKPLGK